MKLDNAHLIQNIETKKSTIRQDKKKISLHETQYLKINSHSMAISCKHAIQKLSLPRVTPN